MHIKLNIKLTYKILLRASINTYKILFLEKLNLTSPCQSLNCLSCYVCLKYSMLVFFRLKRRLKVSIKLLYCFHNCC